MGNEAIAYFIKFNYFVWNIRVRRYTQIIALYNIIYVNLHTYHTCLIRLTCFSGGIVFNVRGF